MSSTFATFARKVWTEAFGSASYRGMKDMTCNDICPTDTTQRCGLDKDHDGWHEGSMLRWRRT